MATGLQARRRAEALFSAFSGDFLLREQFVTDPAQIVNEYVQRESLPPETAAAANHMLYAVMSNPSLVEWLTGYARRHAAGAPSTATFQTDFAKAVASTGDPVVISALVSAAAQDKDLFTAQSSLLLTLVSILGAAGGGVFQSTEMSPGGTTEMSPGTATEMSPGAVFRPGELQEEIGRGGQVFAATEMSPGGTTEMSPGAVFRGGLQEEIGRGGQVFAATEMSPGGTTEMSPGTATEMSPGAVFRPGFGEQGGIFASTEMSPGSGTTEMSPGGTSTEITPGTSTEMSPGAFGRIDLAATLAALVQFSTQLRVAGALDTPAFG